MWLSRAHLAKLVLAIVLAQGVGLVGAFFTAESVSTWYPTLVQPDLSPPAWVFGPVWTILYVLIGIALFLVWTRHIGGHKRTLWLRLFFVQLILNGLWSFLFFGQKMLFGALVDIGLLATSILLLIGIALRFDKRVSVLLLPYLVWVGFATYLNYAIWQLNS